MQPHTLHLQPPMTSFSLDTMSPENLLLLQQALKKQKPRMKQKEQELLSKYGKDLINAIGIDNLLKIPEISIKTLPETSLPNPLNQFLIESGYQAIRSVDGHLQPFIAVKVMYHDVENKTSRTLLEIFKREIYPAVESSGDVFVIKHYNLDAEGKVNQYATFPVCTMLEWNSDNRAFQTLLPNAMSMISNLFEGKRVVVNPNGSYLIKV